MLQAGSIWAQVDGKPMHDALSSIDRGHPKPGSIGLGETVTVAVRQSHPSLAERVQGVDMHLNLRGCSRLGLRTGLISSSTVAARLATHEMVLYG